METSNSSPKVPIVTPTLKPTSNSRPILITILVFIILITLAVAIPALGFVWKVKDKENVFTHQSASIIGTVTKVDGNTITVQNTQTHITKQFPLANQFTIAKSNGSNVKPQLSRNKADIELNKQANIVLTYENSDYFISFITYLPPSTIPPVAQ